MENDILDSKLTVLSFGGGQDSTAILYKIIYDSEFRKRWVKGELLVVMADTLNEHQETYDHINSTKRLCAENGIEFYLLGMEYTTGDWHDGLIGFYEAGDRIGSVTFGKTCTVRLKIEPIYRFLNDWIYLKFGIDGSNAHDLLSGVITKSTKTNLAIREFGATHGKINMILGIAKAEESRLAKDVSNEKDYAFWVRKYYPLVVENMDRKACQEYIKSTGNEVPIPSACVLCHYMNPEEILYIYRFQRNWWNKWVDLERKKIENSAFNYAGEIFTVTLGNKELGKFVAVDGVDKSISELIKATVEKINRKEAKKSAPVYVTKEDFKITSSTIPLTYDISKTINTHRNKGKIVNNNGVKGVAPDRLLPYHLELAQKSVGHMTDDEIREYRFSHGHCVRNKF